MTLTLGPDFKLPFLNLPQKYPEPQVGTGKPLAVPANWWRLYSDGDLDRLVAHGLERNADVRIAVARLEEAEAFMREVLVIPGLRSLYFVTHDVDLALTHADRILLFREGRVVADGPPMEVIADVERWKACNLRVTSLMEANMRWGPAAGRFLDADTLARRVVAHDPTSRPGPGREAEGVNC